MNIYLSQNIESIYFFETTTNFNTAKEEYSASGTLAFIIYMLSKNINSLEYIANELKSKLKINATTEEIEEKILENTIYSEKNKKYFTIDEHSKQYKIYSSFGEKFPQILHIELTGACNFHCDHCYKNANPQNKYIDYEQLISLIYKPLINKTQVVHLTGGEPTLHPDFEKIVKRFHDTYTLQLTTNGTNIAQYPISLFKNFQAIDISLYGLNDEEYLANTHSHHAFNDIINSCKKLSDSGILFRHTVVLNEENFNKMEEYLKLAIETGASSFGYSLPTKSGRLLQKDNKKWELSKQTKKIIYQKFRELEVKYKDKIYISPWYRSQYASGLKYKNENDKLTCSAGSTSWWVSENLMFRPCSFLPNEYINLDYDTWYKYISNEQEIDWYNARKSLELFAFEHNVDITDLCTVFRK